MITGEVLNGDWQCDECEYCEHEPKSRVCPRCGGEMAYMMTVEDDLREQLKSARQTIAEQEKRIKELEERLTWRKEMECTTKKK